ncbi:hypothetical protein [Dipodfec virus RodF1_11]|uniref:DUF5675 domain-containing protein n=1 Tax=Dipodfec virus RodF1_11 TaxID=2929288 RepID=A0A976N2J1_9VIRU|nr:hypothetical protein [Dipodfec virus RodF1_11]
MRLELNRYRKSVKGNFIYGCLSLLGEDGKELFQCSCLENLSKSIPVGKYTVKNLYSPKFDRMMLRLVDVPDRSGILIHQGNYAKDSRGCILVGFKPIGIQDPHFLVSSSKALTGLYKELGLLSHPMRCITLTITINNLINI